MAEGEARKAAYLGMPGYSHLSPGAARGFYRASAGGLDVHTSVAESSLLAMNMNVLWCDALNRRLGGRAVDYFAMQHADVEPADGWLDAMAGEMEARGLDVLSAVVPLKDERGLTSTAVARPDGDPWGVARRLTMSDVYGLPETFTSADVGGPLLVNTGLWVCRFGPWADRVLFTINDRIVRDPAGRYRPESESEDWYVSRLFHSLGLRVGATRLVQLGHRGPAVYPNAFPWGRWQVDFDNFRPPDAFPADVPGWLSEAEGRELARLAEGKDVLEVGSYCGRSTVCMARTARSVTAVDPFDGRATPRPGPTRGAFESNLSRYGVRGKVTVHAGTLAECAGSLAAGSFDLAFIDADHGYESVRFDAGCAARLVRPGGLVAFHDYRTRPGEYDGGWDPGVTRAVDEWVAAGAELVGRRGTVAVVRPPKKPAAGP